MKHVLIYKEVNIYKDKSDKDKPFVTVQPVPVRDRAFYVTTYIIGVLHIRHKTIKDAKQYIDNL